MKIAKNLYVYPWTDPQANNCNSYVLTGRVNVLIDPGHDAFASSLTEELQRDGIEPESINLVINTHCHPDHCEANGRFQQMGAMFAIHEEEHNFLKNSGRSLFVQLGIEPPANPFHILLTEGSLRFGKESVEVYHTPGHSPGGICIYWPAYRALFSGDTLFAMGVGRVDLPGGNAEALGQSLERLIALDIEYLLPGHGQMVKGRGQIRQLIQVMSAQVLPYL